jgi:16S rRNA processing protein RimM
MPSRKAMAFLFTAIMEKGQCFKIGYVAKTHGLKGEVTLNISEPINFDSIESIFVEQGGSLVPHFVSNFSDRGDKVFIKFEDIDTMEKASLLKGSSLFIPKETRPKLKRGEFYDDEVIGFTVIDENKGDLGEITEVSSSGPNRLLSVNVKGREVLIPVNSPFVISTNKTKKIIRVVLPDGFLEI